MVEISFVCPNEEEFEKVCNLLEEEVDFADGELEQPNTNEGYLCIEENYSGSVGMPDEAQELAMSLIDCSEETIFDISGSTLTNHSNMDFEVQYDGKVCTISDTGWYWYIWLGNYSTAEEFIEKEIGNWQFYPDEKSKQHRIDSLKAVFSEAKKSDELYYNDHTYEYFANCPEKGKPQIMMWSALPENMDKEITCTFCHCAVAEGEGAWKRIQAPDAPDCLICPTCAEKYDFSAWDDIDAD